MGQQDTGTWLSGEDIERILWSARRAGTMLIVPRGYTPDTIDRLAEEGLVRHQLGHLVLTLKGHERRRRCSQQMALTA